VGFQEGNITRLFILSEAYNGLWYSPWFSIKETTVKGTSVPVQTRDQYISYFDDLHPGIAIHFFEGIEFYLEKLPSSEANSTILTHVEIEIDTNLAFFLRLASLNGQYLEDYPFDAYIFGFGLLVFHRSSFNESVSFNFAEDFFISSTMPLVPRFEDRVTSFEQTGWGYLELISKSGRVSEYVTRNIILIRNDFERTFIPMLLLVSILLFIIIGILCWENKLREAITVFLSLVVLDIGIFEKLGRVEWLIRVPNMLAVLDLFFSAALIITAILFKAEHITGDHKTKEKNSNFSRKLNVIRLSSIVPIFFYRIFLGSILCNQFKYFLFALREIYVSIAFLILLIAILLYVSLLIYMNLDLFSNYALRFASWLRKKRNIKSRIRVVNSLWNFHGG